MGGKKPLSRPKAGSDFKIEEFLPPEAAEMCCARSALGSKSSKIDFCAPQARKNGGYEGVYFIFRL